MHWVEGVIMFGAGIMAWLIGDGTFPADPRQRARLERAMPLVRNRRLMFALAIFLCAFGGLALANGLLGLGLL